MPYSAGTVFLQVVMSYEGVHDSNKKAAQAMGRAFEKEIDEGTTRGARKAADNAKKIFGDTAEKSGEEAGKKYAGKFRSELSSALKNLDKEFAPIQIQTDDSKLVEMFERYKAEAKKLSKIDIKPGMDTTEIERRAVEVAVFLKRTLKDQDFRVRMDTSAATASLDRLAAATRKLDTTIKVDADTTLAERKLGSFERKIKDKLSSAMSAIGDSGAEEIQKLQARMQALHLKKIGIDISGEDAKREINQIERDLAHLAATTTSIQIHADASEALVQLALVGRRADEVDKKRPKIRVKAEGADDANKKLGLLSRIMGHLTVGGQSAANSFRFFNFTALVTTSIGAALIPILSALAGGMLFLGVAALGLGAALGIMIAGFSGVGTAVSALNDAQDNAAKDAQANSKKIRNAAEQVADAERSLTRAREDAAQRAQDAEQAVVDAKQQASRSIEQALQRQEDSERRLAQAQVDAKQAQLDLIEARKEAQKELDDIAARQRKNAVDERQGVIDLFNATVENTAAQQDPGATNLEKEQASINLENAKIRLEELRKEQKELTDQSKKGIDQSDKVKTAQDRVTAALQAQADAQRDLLDSQKELDRARLDGARSIKDALEQQSRTQKDNSQAIEDATRNLTRAQQDYKDALYETGELGSSSMQKVNDALGKLSPAGKAFAIFLHGLRDEWIQLRSAIQEGLLPGVQAGLKKIIDVYGEDFIKFAGDMAKVLGDLFKNAADVFTNPAWREFFKVIAEIAPVITKDFGKSFLDWMSTFAVLATAAAPFALILSQAMKELSDKVLAWVKSKEGQKAIHDFFAYVVEIAPDVKEFFKALVKALVKVIEALSLFGDDILDALTDILNWIADMDPKTLGQIILAVFGLVAAFQALSGIVAILSVVSGPIGLIALGVFALVAAFIYLYQTNENFKKLVQEIWPVIQEVLKAAFDVFLWNMNALSVALLWLGDQIGWVWNNWLKPFLDWFGRVMADVWAIVGPILGDIARLFRKIGDDVAWMWDKVVWPVLKKFGEIAWNLYIAIMKPALEGIGTLFGKMGDALKWVWDHVISPVFGWIMDKLGVDDNMKENGGGLVGAFRSAIQLIGTIWDGLAALAKKPVDFLVNTIINGGIIAGFNELAKHLPGLQTVEPLPWPPPGFKTGGIDPYGVRPGYTPGRDTHTIAVSGGEAILRPEATRALGPDWVHAINKRARFRGVQGVSDMLQGFKTGGIVGGDFARTTWRGHTLNYRTIRMLETAEKLANTVIKVTQGSYSTSVAASGSTHAGGGAFDLHWPGGALGEALVTALRFVGTASWHRDPSQGPWGHHIHGIAIGDPTASPAALAQVRSYLSGGNGLGGKDDGPQVAKDPSLLDRIGGAIGGAIGWVTDAISNPVDWLKGKIAGKLEQITKDFGDNTLVKTLKAIPEAIITGMGQMISGGFDFLTGGGGSGDLKSMVQNLAQTMFGWSGNQWSAIDFIVGKESGWDPKAANKNSTAEGLFQLLKGTADGYGGQSSDPQVQARQGLQYIHDRYGDPLQAKAFWEGHNWYSEGGVVPDNGTMMYDQGGYLPPGVTRVVNLTGKPEPVFTNEQFEGMGRKGSARDGFTYSPTFNESDLTAADVAQDLVFTLTRLDQGVIR